MSPKPPRAFHIDLVITIDHDLGDVGRGQQGFQGPQSHGFVQYFSAQGLLGRVVGQIDVRRDDMRQQTLGFGAQCAVAHARDVAPAQVQRVE
ncbi:hypothetical protein D3C73_1280440 [compost metagenome]